MTTVRQSATVLLVSVAIGLLLASCSGKPPTAGKDGHGGETSPGVLVGPTDSDAASGSAIRAPDAKALACEILDATGVKGGFVVHVGCGDGKLTAALRASDGYLVHGLARGDADLAKARAHAASLGVYGKVSIDRFEGTRLPYVDNLVNLVVSEDLGDVPRHETMRVLCPGGVAYVKQGGKWKKSVKPRPPGIDQWTHYLYDATNNAVSRDRAVGPPRQLQWVGSPNWARHHDRMASMNALVATRDRLFYVFDEGPTSSIMLPPAWTLIARDAFSGVVLWKRRLPTWHPHLWPMKSGFAQMPRRLVAVGDRAYVPLGYEEPLSCLDAATGKTLWTCAETKSVEEVICSDGVLYVLANPRPSQYAKFKPEFENKMWDAMRRAASSMPWDEQPRFIAAVRADTGRVLWRREHRVAPLTLACAPRNVLFFDGERIVCLDRKSGDEAWRSDKLNTDFPLSHFTKNPQKNTQKWRPPSTKTSFLPASFAPTLVAYKDVVLFSGGDGHMSGIAGETGKVLWTAEVLPGGHFSPQDCLVIGGRVWTAAIAGGRDSGEMLGRDPKTGKVVDRFSPDIESWYMHHRCHRAKATDRWFLASRTGIEFVDHEKHHWIDHHWVRGGCLYGIMPCNGLLYAPPHSCACYMQSKLFGFNALTSRTSKAEPIAVADRLERGEAYDKPVDAQEAKDEWPTYRGGRARSGFTRAPVPAALGEKWRTRLGGNLTSLVCAGGKIYVANKDMHVLHALDAGTGKTSWTHTAGGRIDSPPTVSGGRVVFGSADGRVYCLRASDGAVIWRLLAAPRDERLVAFEQVESLWPVSGSVLVRDGAVYCVAGRSMFLEGGLRLLKIDVKTGRLLSETVMDDRDPGTGKNLQSQKRNHNMPVALPDVLASDGEFLYMRSQRMTFNGKRSEIAPADARRQDGQGMHLFSPIGFLDGSWWHRGYWVYGRRFAEGAGGYPVAGRHAPAGRILAVDDSNVYGYGRRPEFYRWTTPLEYRLFSASKRLAPGTVPAGRGRPKPGQKRPRVPVTRPKLNWTRAISLHVRAMVLAGGTLFVAGPADTVDEVTSFPAFTEPETQARLAAQRDAVEGKKGAAIHAVSAADGRKLAEYPLGSVPVWDGLIAAGGRLYLSTRDGSVICLGR